MLVYEHDDFKKGDSVISTLAKTPTTRVIKYFIVFKDYVNAYFNDKLKITNWKYKKGLLKKIN